MTHEEKAAELLKRCLEALPYSTCEGHGDFTDNTQLKREVKNWLEAETVRRGYGGGQPIRSAFFPNGERG